VILCMMYHAHKSQTGKQTRCTIKSTVGNYFCDHIALQQHRIVVVLSDCGFPTMLYGKLWHVSV
jgi:hypothetical protein